MKTKAKILEDWLNEYGFSINDTLRPKMASVRFVKGIKKALYGAMEEYAELKASQSQFTDERENVKHFLLWYNTSIRERYYDDEHNNYVLDEYFKSPRDKQIPTKD